MELERTLERPLDSKQIKPVNPKRNQPWIFIGRNAAKAEVPILWTSNAKSWLIGKDPDAGKDWGQEEKETEDEMAGWHDQFNGHELEESPGDGEGQGSLVLQSMELQRVGHDWATKQQHKTPNYVLSYLLSSINFFSHLIIFSCFFSLISRSFFFFLKGSNA